MTPLAHRIVKDMLQPVKQRTFDVQPSSHPSILTHFREEFHCFELTQIAELAKRFNSEMLEAGFPSVAFSFLPAERTWLEWRDRQGIRLGVMLVRKGDFADVYVASDTPFLGGFVASMALVGALSKFDPTIRWENSEQFLFTDVQARGRPAHTAKALLWQTYARLLLINTPNIVTKTPHDPHRGLARQILAERKLLGIFPLQAWTEITLRIGTTVTTGDPTTAKLTGMKCFHWTRSHRKRVHGQWTIISDYWSGDGSLGIKQSRYKVLANAD
jgi:hypothetical protein